MSVEHHSIKYLKSTEFVDMGFLQEVNRLFFHPRGLAMQLDPVSGAVKFWDYREDPEGMFYADDVIDQGKIDRVEFERMAHLPARCAMFNGETIQR